LPIQPGKAGTLTHDYKRHGRTTLFAAFNVLDGVAHGRCMQKHAHQEFIRLLSIVERGVPAGKIINTVLDNYATHKHPEVRAWLERHPRLEFHFTPTTAPGHPKPIVWTKPAKDIPRQDRPVAYTLRMVSALATNAPRTSTHLSQHTGAHPPLFDKGPQSHRQNHRPESIALNQRPHQRPIPCRSASKNVHQSSVLNVLR
jgi:hypothetical protein